MVTITGIGVFDVPAADYHADKLLDVPTLNAGTAKILLEQSPLHAWHSHPRLNHSFEPEDNKKKNIDFGSVMHATLLGGATIAVIDAENYRTKAAQEARAAALERGSVPVLPHQMEDVRRACQAVRLQLRHHEASDALTAGKAEQTLIWQEREPPIWCRAKLDWLPNNRMAKSYAGLPIYDLKTTTDANPQIWVHKLFDLGADIQAVFYSRGIHAVLGISNPIFRFVVIENAPPFALSVIQLSPSALDLAARKVDDAMRLWAKCLKDDLWPGYDPYVFHVDSPPYQTQRFEERQLLREQRKQFDEGTTILGAG